MHKPVLFSVLIISSILSACSPETSSSTTPVVPAAPIIIIPSPQPTEPVCKSLNLQPTPGPDTPSLFPPVNENDYVRGEQDATVTILIYNDFQCTDCNYLSMSLLLLENHPNDVRIVYRYYPYTTLFDKGELAARAAEAAAKQGRFWQVHDFLFEEQTDWVDLPVDSFEGWITTRIGELELDSTRFTTEYNSAETIERVQQAAEEGEKIGIPRLPFYLVNGQIYRGPVDFEAFNQVINLIKLGERQFVDCPPMTIDAKKKYFATLETEYGNVVLQLYADKAPNTVNSFIFLAQQGWFDGITFHRVLPGFVVQTGDPSGTGQGNPGYMFNNEIDPSLKFDQVGILGMANSGTDTNGSQFFITLAPAPDLDGAYTIFGRVMSGMEVLKQLIPRNPQPGVSLPPGDKLISVTIEEK